MTNEEPNVKTNEENLSENHIDLGKKGERAASVFLQRRGYHLLEKNWWSPAGEADLVVEDEETGTIVFVEVKTRSSVEKGFPEESVTLAKRKKYEKIAAYWLKDNAEGDISVRFDVISILVLGEGRAYVRHHINAFGRDA